MFKIPADSERYKIWLNCMGRIDLLTKPSSTLHRNVRVCADHFEDKYFISTLRTRLQRFAQPIPIRAVPEIHAMQDTPDMKCNIVPELQASSSSICDAENTTEITRKRQKIHSLRVQLHRLRARAQKSAQQSMKLNDIILNMQFNEPNPLAFSKLGLAAHIGDAKSVAKLLARNHRVDLADNRGWTPIHEAAANDRLECLRLLLRGKGKRYVNQRTMEGYTPLLLACVNSTSSAIIELLISKGADVNLGNNENCTPIHEVCRLGNLKLAQVLVEAGCDVNRVDYNVSTPLHHAVSSQNVELIEFLLANGADVDRKDECFCTPLCLACLSGKWELVEPILLRNPDVNSRTRDKSTPLMLAAQSANLKVVSELLKHGADPNLAAEDHTLALHQAVHSGDSRILKLLLDVTSKEVIYTHCFHKNAIHPNLLCLAIDSESLECVRALLDSGLDSKLYYLPIAVDQLFELMETGLLPHELHPISFLFLHKLASLEEETFTFLDLLLSKGISVNTTERNILPPLPAACLVPNDSPVILRCIKKILEHGADTEYSIHSMQVPAPLLCAADNGRWETVYLLLRYGSGGSPEHLIKILISRHRLDTPIEQMVKFLINGLLILGVTDATVLRMLRDTIMANMGFWSMWKEKYEALNKFIDGNPVCSLQQLCRAKIRCHMSGNVKLALECLSLPEPVKHYLLYYT